MFCPCDLRTKGHGLSHNQLALARDSNLSGEHVWTMMQI